MPRSTSQLLSSKALIAVMFFGIAALGLSSSLAAEIEKPKKWGPILTDALVITVSPDSADYVKERLMTWMTKGYPLNRLAFPAQEQNVSIDLSSTAQAQNMAAKILSGMFLSSPQPIQNLQVKIKSSQGMLALKLDSELTSLKWKEHIFSNPAEAKGASAVDLEFTTTIPSIDARVPEISLSPEYSELLGSWKIKNLAITNRKRSGIPLQVTSNFVLRIEKDGLLKLALISSEQNLKNVGFMMKADGIEINGGPGAMSKLQTMPIESALLFIQDPLIAALKAQVEKALNQQLVDSLNLQLDKLSQQALYQSRDSLPQAPHPITDEQLVDIRFRPSSIGVDKFKNIKLHLSAQLMDKIFNSYTNNFHKFRPNEKDLMKGDDLTIELNPDYMNQLLYQSYMRGYFTKMGGSGFEIEFMKAPEFLVSADGVLRVLSEMSLNIPPTVFSSQLLAEFQGVEGGDFNMMAVGTIQDSFKFKDQFEGGAIAWSGKKIFNALDGYLRHHPYMLQEGMPLPSEFGPIGVNYTRIQAGSFTPEAGSSSNETGSIVIFGKLR